MNLCTTSHNARTTVPSVSARSGFSGYGPGGRQRISRQDVKEDEVLKQLIDVWNKFKKILVSGSECKDVDEFRYSLAFDMIKGITYSCEDVERFSIALAESQIGIDDLSQRIGLFLSALINNCDDPDYTISIGNLGSPPQFLGFRNKKIITVDGGVGKFLGYRMVSGKITVKGIPERAVAYQMKGGEIHIEGEFHFPDSCEEIVSSCLEHGKIFHKGELIVDI